MLKLKRQKVLMKQQKNEEWKQKVSHKKILIQWVLISQVLSFINLYISFYIKILIFNSLAPSTLAGASEVQQPKLLTCQLKPYQLKGLLLFFHSTINF